MPSLALRRRRHRLFCFVFVFVFVCFPSFSLRFIILEILFLFGEFKKMKNVIKIHFFNNYVTNYTPTTTKKLGDGGKFQKVLRTGYCCWEILTKNNVNKTDGKGENEGEYIIELNDY